MSRQLLVVILRVACFGVDVCGSDHSVARLWNEQLLNAIRNDTARPTIHARNLYHVSAAMYDAWAAYDNVASQVLYSERATATDVESSRNEAISYAAYRLLRHRFVDGPGGTGPGRLVTSDALDDQMIQLGYDVNNQSQLGDSAAALGNRIADSIIHYGLNDGANEQADYANPSGYEAVNPPMTFDIPGTQINNPNRWQPLKFLRERRDQFGQLINEQVQGFLSPYWGDVKSFAMTAEDRSVVGVYHDQGLPPQLNGFRDAEFRTSVNEIIRYSSKLAIDSTDMINISPASRGNSLLGTYQQQGYAINPATQLPYEPQIVQHGDWGRIIAEFWADGPDSEAPPGHWNVIGNDVSDKLDELGVPKRIGGLHPVSNNLEWDVKMYLALNGAVHDAGIAAWNHKGVYDYSRPVSMIRYMGQLGQSSDPNLTVNIGGNSISTYHPDGLTLDAGLVEVITPASTSPGNAHEHLAGHEGEIAIYAWQGPPEYPIESADDMGGVGWILAEEWLPYQRDDFVTPPFAAYLSGHSTFSRAAAEVMARLTGDKFFPGGMFEYDFHEGEGLEFEYGPSTDLTLQWATYFDASDEAGLSRLYGGIHVPADDLPGRIIGSEIGLAAWDRATQYFVGVPEPSSLTLLVVAMLFIVRNVRTKSSAGQ
ncbi:MAG: vanadium-dependent haloperoxidase [Planctomycetales bacterium]|nr:vanadium-dependent haloperoxidase [Planctomycetales bacterium]